MAVSNIKVNLPYSLKQVWNLVTSLENYSWRSDLSAIEIISENQFVEYTRGGYATTFTITVSEPYRRWEFDMENDNMNGHWTGLFSENGNSTVIDFTEDITPKKLLMKPFVGIYLKKQQSAYVKDLEKALSGYHTEAK